MYLILEVVRNFLAWRLVSLGFGKTLGVGGVEFLILALLLKLELLSIWYLSPLPLPSLENGSMLLDIFPTVNRIHL